MKFGEPHSENRPPLRAKDLMDFSPVKEGIRYVWRDPRLRTTIFVKAGVGFLGANWVLLPIFGERIFPIRRAGFTQSQAGMLGMSLLMACRGIGAILGPVVSGYWAAGIEKRMRLGILFGYLAGVVGYLMLGHAPGLAIACLGIMLAQRRRVRDVGFLIHAAANSYGGQISRASVFGGMGAECFDDVDVELLGWCADRSAS